MSLRNFVPTIWSDRVQKSLDNTLVLAKLCNRNYEGEVSRFGEAVKIQKAGDVAVNSYNGGTITYTLPQSTTQSLLINRRSLGGFAVDSVDEIQANVNLLDTYSNRLGFALGTDIDRVVAAEYVNAFAGDIPLNVSTAITAGDIINAFADAGQLLDSNSVPTEGRWSVISPKLHAAMPKDARIWTGLNTADQLAVKGQNYLGQFMGFDLYKSNNLLGTGVTVTLTAPSAALSTTLTCTALTAAVPVGTILTFGPGQAARVTVTAATSATSITVQPLTVPLASGAVATYVKVRKCMFGTNDAITFASQKSATVEALRDKDTTSDYLRAEQIYGLRTIEGAALGTLTVTEA